LNECIHDQSLDHDRGESREKGHGKDFAKELSDGRTEPVIGANRAIGMELSENEFDLNRGDLGWTTVLRL
jgi:hypothetical protein